jgi:hypothetical protein
MLRAVTLRVETAGEWAPMRASVDAERFDRGRIGPYLIGNSLRSTDFGEVSMALHDSLERVVELELFEKLANTPSAGPDGRLMPDLAIASSVEHPNVARIIGAGMEQDTPYVVRPLVLGRTLAQLLAHADPPSKEIAACIVFAVTEGLNALADHGPEPGACSIGGFDHRDVFLAFEGGVLILGSGTKGVRAPDEDATARDFASLIRLADQLGVNQDLESARTFSELARLLRYAHRDALAKRRELLGSALRECFDAAINEERAFFGLDPLQ